jgi:23S rRNA (guanine745-N1)-methyltransferase
LKIEKKITVAKNNLEKYIDFLKCPLCGEAFDLHDFSLRCGNKHNYDLAKKGYANLFNGFTKIVKTYDKDLFSARKIISDSGLYSGLSGRLCELISMYGAKNILDAGCGCGNLTHEIFKNTGAGPVFAVDLSKDGIDFAAVNFCEHDLIWLVANLNNLPFAENKFDVILNIMSPANYQEFRRVLKSGGILLKVLPDSDYLKELRRFIYGANDRNEYSNKDVLNNLAENTDIKDIAGVKYTRSVAVQNIPALFDMTPLTSNINEREQIKQDLIRNLSDENKDFEITLAFKIAVCKI